MRKITPNPLLNNARSLNITQSAWIADVDWQDVGPRFLEPIPDGKYKGFT
ncbi:MAG: hypothetical protein HYV01_14560, partial [Deltaproteobacteria bacterium]|nr:hypothetical protein [Deltaproteobacteria bacterium]